MKGCEDLVPWIRSVSNDLLWCSATCGGNAEALREKCMSIMFHVTNKETSKMATVSFIGGAIHG